MKHTVDSYKMRIQLLESRGAAMNARIIAKLKRKIRALEAINS